MWQIEIPEGATALGYKKLTELFKLKAIAHFRWSYASPKWEKREHHFKDQNLTVYIYPHSYQLSDNVFEHLEFALKHEGINLYILKKVLAEITLSEITAYIVSRPTGKYARILWYLYENFNNRKLPLPDLKQATYVPLLDPEDYYSGKPKRSARHRISDNLLGSLDFAPIVRKTSLLKDYEKRQIKLKAQQLAQQYDPILLSRAMRYLYTKEAMSSWEIEREKPDNAKLAKFVGLLQKADSIGVLSEQTFVELQRAIVDPRFSQNSYRDFQNYVGEEPGMGQLLIHYIAPKPEAVRDLMNNLILSFDIMEKSAINPIIAAAILSFVFVYIHPFEDGNGRIHRFLIHYALTRFGFTPPGIVFPVSVAFARDIKRYDTVLELFSKPLMELIVDYKVNDIGEMTVFQDTHDFYRYIDLTFIAEYLYECVDKTVATDFKEELAFLAEYDTIKHQCKEIVDMSDQRIDLFIKCVRQNNGTLSSRKRETHFKMLTEDEIKKMENVINRVTVV